MIDEGACASGADAVHALLHVAALEIDDLRVLAAQLDGHVRLRRQLLQCGGHRYDLLGEGHLQAVCQGQAAGARDHGVQGEVPKLLICFVQKSGQGLPDIGKVALIIGKQNPVPCVQNRDLHRGGAYINAQKCPGIAQKCLGIAFRFCCEFHAKSSFLN